MKGPRLTALGTEILSPHKTGLAAALQACTTVPVWLQFSPGGFCRCPLMRLPEEVPNCGIGVCH